MKALLFTIGIVASSLSIGCTNRKEASTEEEKKEFAAPQFQVRYERDEPVSKIDLVAALSHERDLKLSSIANSIEYYIVGDATYPVTQVVTIPDSSGIVTFNYPRIYYRRQNMPSKRLGFKALAYQWNQDMDRRDLFYDKKSRKMFVALSGRDKTNKDTSAFVVPSIGELPVVDSLINASSFLFIHNIPAKYPLNTKGDTLNGFWADGYVLNHTDKESSGITSFNLAGDTLCKMPLTIDVENNATFRTFWWNAAQDRMSFMIPHCDTLFQLRETHIITPLFAFDRGMDDKSQLQIRTMCENKGTLFIGIRQKEMPYISNWLGQIDTFRPEITQRIVYDKNKSFALPRASRGLINDIDLGLPFWPDGQTDEGLYMICPVTEMRETVIRTDSPKQKKLLELLDNPKVKENQFVVILVK